MGKECGGFCCVPHEDLMILDHEDLMILDCDERADGGGAGDGEIEIGVEDDY